MFELGFSLFDTDGKEIDAHAQCFIKVDSVYYMFGENRIDSKNNNFYAFNCYKSTDCVNWTFVREVLLAADIGITTVSTRATVIYNEKTKKYVMYFKCKTSERKYGIATCSTVDGKYDFVGRFHTLKNDVGDAKLFQETDGTAYYVYSCLVNNVRHIVIDKLSEDYLTPVQIVSDREVRLEAPIMFKKGDTYYIIASGVSGWNPNQGKYSYSKSPAGPWSEWFNFGNSKTYDSQSACILTIAGSETMSYIFSGDRWESPLSNSSYVWLPIQFNGEKIFIDYYDSFFINANTGEVKTSLTNAVSQNQSESLSFYPTVVSDMLHLIGLLIPQRVEVYDLQGNLQVDTITTQSINCSKLTPGVYIVRTDGNQIFKFIKV
jgi:hypothetical protein